MTKLSSFILNSAQLTLHGAFVGYQNLNSLTTGPKMHEAVGFYMHVWMQLIVLRSLNSTHRATLTTEKALVHFKQISNQLLSN